MIEKKSVLSNMPAVLAATGGFITAIVGLLAFMSTPAPSIAEFDASQNIIAPGESSILKWSVSGDGAVVTIEPDIGIVALSGNREVTPGITTNYTLTARNKDQSKVASLQILVRERDQADAEVPAGAVAQPEASEPEDLAATPVSKESDISEPVSEEEELDSAKSTVTKPSGSQQKATEELSDPAAETAGKENEIYEPAPEAEDKNPVKSTVTTRSDSLQLAPAEIALTAASLGDNSWSASGEEQEAIVESGPVVEPETYINTDAATDPDVPIKSSSVQSPPTESGTVDRATAAAPRTDSDQVAATGPDTASDETGTHSKAVKVITSADWNRSEISRSKNDFISSAPIYAKLRDTEHISSQPWDVEDASLSESGLSGSDPLGMDISGQGPQSEGMRSPDAAGPDPLGPAIM